MLVKVQAFLNKSWYIHVSMTGVSNLPPTNVELVFARALLDTFFRFQMNDFNEWLSKGKLQQITVLFTRS